jgi:hypothetical protein
VNKREKDKLFVTNPFLCNSNCSLHTLRVVWMWQTPHGLTMQTKSYSSWVLLRVVWMWQTPHGLTMQTKSYSSWVLLPVVWMWQTPRGLTIQTKSYSSWVLLRVVWIVTTPARTHNANKVLLFLNLTSGWHFPMEILTNIRKQHSLRVGPLFTWTEVTSHSEGHSPMSHNMPHTLLSGGSTGGDTLPVVTPV